jgi:alkaline phosphatase D
MARGDVDAAIKLSAEPPAPMNSPISEAEHHFVLTMAYCIKGDTDAAFKNAKTAVEKGLPLDRLQAGPRAILEPLYKMDGYKAWMKGRELQLLHGPLLGSLSDSQASFWVRTANESDVTIVVNPFGQENQESSRSGKARSDAKLDYTARVEVTGLKPKTEYEYQVSIDGKPQGEKAGFTTHPKKGEAADFSIVFGGCAGFTPQHERIWTTIAKYKPTAMVLLGDNVYIDDPEHQVSQQYCYYRRQSQADWKALTSSTGVFTIYDDHDFGENDCEPGPEIDKPAWKIPVWQTFRNNWANPGYGGGEKQPGCWYSFEIGNVQFIMLDGRYYRDLESGSMLGPVQKQWLFDTLKSSKATFKVLASPVPWSPGVKPGSKDTWDGFPDEREEIFAFIEKHKIDGVLLMAADRHRSDLRRIKRPDGYDLYEMLSARLTNVHTHPLVQNAKGSEFIMGYNKECSFGLVDFETTLTDPKLNYRIVNIDNEEVGAHVLKLSELSFGGAGE